MTTASSGSARALWLHLTRFAAPCGLIATGTPFLTDRQPHPAPALLIARAIALAAIFARFYFGDSGMFIEEGRLTSPEMRRDSQENPLSAALLLLQPACLALCGFAIPSQSGLAFPVLSWAALAFNVLWLFVRQQRYLKVLSTLGPGHPDMKEIVRVCRYMSVWYVNNVIFLLVSLAIAYVAARWTLPHAALVYCGAILLSSLVDWRLTRAVYRSSGTGSV